jgi:hypothetical protein
MKKTMLYFLIAAIFTACQKEQPALADGQAGCDCAREVSAAFLQEEMATPIGWDKIRKTDTDTAYAEGNVRFYAVEENAEYTWYIGSEVLHEREVYRYFDNSTVGAPIPITLVVRKTPNNICLPNDDGYDSVTRYLTMVPSFNDNFFLLPHYLLEGTFRLKQEGATDSLDVQVQFLDSSEPGPGGVTERYIFTNLDGQNGVLIAGSGSNFTYRQVWPLTSGYTYSRWHHRLDGVLELELISIPEAGLPNYHMKGRKLN